MNWAVILAALALFGCSLGSDQPAQVIVGATLVDGSSRPPVERSVVVVRKGVIIGLGVEGTVEIPQDATRYNGAGKWVFPLDPAQTLKVGAAADLLLLRVNPALDPEYAAKAAGRMEGGHWVKFPQ